MPAADDRDGRSNLASLLARCALADHAAFRALYDATSAKLFAVLLRILKRRELAEDALQETFVQIWRNAGSYRPSRGTPMTWMISIARYRALDQVRRSHDESHVPVDEEIMTAIDAIRPMADQAALNRCLDRLKGPQRAAVVMAYCEGYTHDELSRRMGSPVGTVKSWIRRGLEILRRCLEP